jgi:hypothetical protein
MIDITARETLKSVMDLKQPNADSKEVNFLEVKNKELLLPELSSENQRFFSLMKLLLP